MSKDQSSVPYEDRGAMTLQDVPDDDDVNLGLVYGGAGFESPSNHAKPAGAGETAGMKESKHHVDHK